MSSQLEDPRSHTGQLKYDSSLSHCRLGNPGFIILVIGLFIKIVWETEQNISCHEDSTILLLFLNLVLFYFASEVSVIIIY